MLIQLKEGVAIGILLVLSYQDIKGRSISGLMIGSSFFLVSAYLLSGGGGTAGIHLMGLMAGIVFCFISYLTKESIGYGDSLLLCVMGLYTGIWRLLEILMISWVLLAVAALGLLLIKNYSKKAALPYIPFLLVAYVCQLLMERGGA